MTVPFGFNDKKKTRLFKMSIAEKLKVDNNKVVSIDSSDSKLFYS